MIIMTATILMTMNTTMTLSFILADSYITSQMKFEWLDPALELPANLHLAQFTLLQTEVANCTNFYSLCEASKLLCLRFC